MIKRNKEAILGKVESSPGEDWANHFHNPSLLIKDATGGKNIRDCVLLALCLEYGWHSVKMPSLSEC